MKNEIDEETNKIFNELNSLKKLNTKFINEIKNNKNDIKN